MDEDQNLLGVFSNGDLALLEDPTHDPSVDWPRPVADWMRTDPLTVAHDSMALAAKELMQENSVLTLVVTDSETVFLGCTALRYSPCGHLILLLSIRQIVEFTVSMKP